MGPRLDELPAVEDEDAVGVHHGVEAVGDGDDRAILPDALERAVEGRLGRRVERARRLVEQEQLGVAHQRPGDAHALALAAREPPPALAHERLVALGERQDPLVDLRGLRGGFDFGVGGIEAAVADVLADREVEEEAVLQHHAHLRAQRAPAYTRARPTPSRSTRPAPGSWSRISRLSVVLLPQPLVPTSAYQPPDRSAKSTPRRVGCSRVWLNSTPSKRISRANGGMGRAPGASATRPTRSSSTSSTRWSPPVACCISANTSESWRMGPITPACSPRNATSEPRRHPAVALALDDQVAAVAQRDHLHERVAQARRHPVERREEAEAGLALQELREVLSVGSGSMAVAPARRPSPPSTWPTRFSCTAVETRPTSSWRARSRPASPSAR